jgi:hypothetical protein
MAATQMRDPNPDFNPPCCRPRLGCRYIELLERDVIRFGLSSREYVLLNDKSVA